MAGYDEPDLVLLDLSLPGADGFHAYSQVAKQLRPGRKELDQRTLRVFVAQLRKKLVDDAADPKLIVTHFGLGYRWIANEVDDT